MQSLEEDGLVFKACCFSKDDGSLIAVDKAGNVIVYEMAPQIRKRKIIQLGVAVEDAQIVSTESGEFIVTSIARRGLFIMNKDFEQAQFYPFPIL